MTEGSIPGADQENIYQCIYHQDMLKPYQRETKLLQFSRDTYS